MGEFWWHAAWGLCLVQLSLAQSQIDLNITCRYAGVFHVEKNGRYSISRTEAPDLCQAFNSTLPTMAQMERALSKGFETCRYGFIEGHVVIPRITPNAICAANNTGVYILTSNTSYYDTYCFNASAPPEEDCTSVTDLPNSFDGPVTITIVNRDGTRYSKQGEYRTNPEDINPTNPIDDDVSSGSSSETSTSGTFIFNTHLPPAQPTIDHDSTWFYQTTQATSKELTSTVQSNSQAATQETSNWIWFWFGNSQPKTQDPTTAASTGTESNTVSTGWEQNEEYEDETDKTLSFSGSDIDDDEDFISSTISSTPWSSDHTKQNQDWTQWKPSHSNSEVLLQTTAGMTAWATPGSATEETATLKEQWSENGWHERQSQTTREGSQATAGTTASAHTHPSQEMTTQSQEDISWTDFLDPISYPMGQGHQEENMDANYSHSTTIQPTEPLSTDLVEDSNRTGSLSVTTQQSHFEGFSTTHGELEEDRDHPTTATPPSSTRSDGRGGRRGGSLPENSTTSLESSTPQYPDPKENSTLTPGTSAKTGAFGETEATVADDSDFHVDDPLSGDRDSHMNPHGESHTTHGSSSVGHSSGSREGGPNTTTSSPRRKPMIPEWLIILASLLALALILAVCIAVNSRRRCGQKKKLVINNGNGTVEERKPSELNGDASKSQEMVHLVNKEPSETPDQFMTADETRNLQNVDMKIGV